MRAQHQGRTSRNHFIRPIPNGPRGELEKGLVSDSCDNPEIEIRMLHGNLRFEVLRLAILRNQAAWIAFPPKSTAH